MKLVEARRQRYCSILSNIDKKRLYILFFVNFEFLKKVKINKGVIGLGMVALMRP